MADVLESRARRTPAWLVLLAVMGLAVAADRFQTGREVDALLREVAAADGTADYADRRVAGTVQYAGSSLTSPLAPAQVRADLQQLVATEAAGQLPAVRRRADDLAGVTVLPWHREVRVARDAAVAHLQDRAEALRAVAEGRQPEAAPDDRARAALAGISSAARADRAYD